MRSTMMRFPLTLDRVLERAGKLFGSSEIVTRLPDRRLHRYSYREFCTRARALGGALQRLGLERGDRVATLMWNHRVHLEAYFGVPCAGGVLHTLNPRLHPDDLAYVADHAGDRFLIVDDILLPLYDSLRARTAFDRVIVVPLTELPVPPEYEDYERLVGRAIPLQPPVLEEDDAAGMCYTSGTTGRPKGVVYSHRSIVLHSLATATVDYLGIGNRDVVCPVVPMFHVHAWGLPFTAVMMGAKLVFPGPHPDAASLLDLCEQEGVTVAAGVPTVWAMVLQALEAAPQRWKLSPGMRMIVGGAAASEAMIRAFDRFGLRVVHGWGMTETSPVGMVNFTKRGLDVQDSDASIVLRAKQGVPLPFFEIRAMGPAGEVPWDGKTMGELEVRGPWVASAYHDLPGESEKWTEDGWFRTGDIVTIDAEGYVTITDRIKDLVKSGGEWISSLALENALAGHPEVAEAAVIALPHPRWGERPLAVVVARPGTAPDPEKLRKYLAGKFPRCQVPDDRICVRRFPLFLAREVLQGLIEDLAGGQAMMRLDATTHPEVKSS